MDAFEHEIGVRVHHYEDRIAELEAGLARCSTENINLQLERDDNRKQGERWQRRATAVERELDQLAAAVAEVARRGCCRECSDDLVHALAQSQQKAAA